MMVAQVKMLESYTFNKLLWLGNCSNSLSCFPHTRKSRSRASRYRPHRHVQMMKRINLECKLGERYRLAIPKTSSPFLPDKPNDDAGRCSYITTIRTGNKPRNSFTKGNSQQICKIVSSTCITKETPILHKNSVWPELRACRQNNRANLLEMNLYISRKHQQSKFSLKYHG